ncbi:MAG TPA: single-stranded DNA-binding protein [Cyclobacteriaceae bacterium]|nr:single-stranded DNA-binding protein [Cyclobacteriaceae bacterium]
MASVNKVTLLGRVGKDVEVRQTDTSTSVANFNVCTSEFYKDKITGEKKEITDWHNIVAWRGLADVAGKYLKKGDQVYITGKMRTRKWDKDGITRFTTEVIADEIQLLGSKKNNQEVHDEQHEEVG